MNVYLSSRVLRKAKWLLLIALVIPVVSTVAYTAGNSASEKGAGSGMGTVSGYAVSSVVWTLDGAAPREIDSVSFDVAPSGGAGSPSEVHATVDNGASWISCTGGPVTWTCTFGAGVIASTANPLRIVSVE